MSFNPNEHLLNLGSQAKPSMYLEVKWRLVWFREQCPEGQIETKIIHLDLDALVEYEEKFWNKTKNGWDTRTKTGKGVAIFQAKVRDGKGGEATGTKSENAASFPDFIEKAESGSIGRALAALGYGTQFAPDFGGEAQRIVDAPVEHQSNAHQTGTTQRGASTSSNASTSANKAQPRSPQQQQQRPQQQQQASSEEPKFDPQTEVERLYNKAIEYGLALSNDQGKSLFWTNYVKAAVPNVKRATDLIKEQIDAVAASIEKAHERKLALEAQYPEPAKPAMQ